MSDRATEHRRLQRQLRDAAERLEEATAEHDRALAAHVAAAEALDKFEDGLDR